MPSDGLKMDRGPPKQTHLEMGKPTSVIAGAQGPCIATVAFLFSLGWNLLIRFKSRSKKEK